MFLHVTDAKYLKKYTVRVAFNDGASGSVDLSSELWGKVFEPLKDINCFRRFEIRGHTLSWDNGADFAPEFLRENIV
ncbi:MAG: hypothetical protein BWK80_08600 [Desulfobacteraceae bacterium IS3]|nr:MAG: hypothetical protein BWK80_08600 [Desulfobacteraceae bacterium IS3]